MQSVEAVGGTGPYTYSASGALPAGIWLNPNGAFSRTATEGGSFTFTVTAPDSVRSTSPRKS
ncbi:hypothetical protein GTW25_18490 [Aliihoeflea aestuarii]|nr:hypothetical protein [Aliihoeflea aestuarii]